MNQNYKEILKVIKKAGQHALDLEKDLVVKKKGDGVDVVTQADHKIEQMLFETISKYFSGDGFWGEENEKLRNDQEYTWYIDPIDGTKYYAAGIPLWSVSVARVKRGEKIPEFSSIYIPKENNLFYAIKGEGAYLNDNKLVNKRSLLLRNNQIQAIEKTTLAFDFSPSEDEEVNKFIYDKFPDLLKNFYRVRFLGVGTLNIAWTVTGFFGCFIKYLQGTKQFNDVVAGLLIAQEAGLKVDHQSLDNSLDRIVICNSESFEKVLKIIK